MRTPGKFALAFIFVTVLIDVIGIGIVVPVMPRLLMQVANVELAQAASWSGVLFVLYAGMQFLFAPMIGNLSDRFGRRPVLIASLLGYSVDFLLMALAPNLAWLFVGRALSGLFAATYSTAGAYIADVSAPEKRAQNFGLIGAAFGLGFTIGPVIGGLLSHIDPRAPFFAAAGLAALNALYGLLVLPESLPPEKRRPFSLRRANPIGALREMSKYPKVLGFASVILLFHLAHWSLPATWAYYAQAQFNWSEFEIGLSLGFVGVCAVIVMGGLSRLILPRLGSARAAAVGLSIATLEYLGFGLAQAGWQIYVVIAAGAFAGLAMPAIQGLLSNAVGDDQQGELQGALTSLQSLTAVIGPLLMTQLFYRFNAADADPRIPGAAFFAAAALALAGLAAFALVLRAARRAEPAFGRA